METMTGARFVINVLMKKDMMWRCLTCGKETPALSTDKTGVKLCTECNMTSQHIKVAK
jgi:hypothetical protein